MDGVSGLGCVMVYSERVLGGGNFSPDLEPDQDPDANHRSTNLYCTTALY